MAITSVIWNLESYLSKFGSSTKEARKPESLNKRDVQCYDGSGHWPQNTTVVVLRMRHVSQGQERIGVNVLLNFVYFLFTFTTEKEQSCVPNNIA